MRNYIDQYNEAPPRVKYELTELFMELVPIWKQLEIWRAKHGGAIATASGSDS
ncbi:winged helix-turn-helix transcriptional regulator [Pedobacter sp. R-06]|uniref:winged helix-turn-helix transcriptional regulator n=1 Tax=Pedobacter sp. R-06 TaxID=3404051 RepID=UPI003CE7F8CF